MRQCTRQLAGELLSGSSLVFRKFEVRGRNGLPEDIALQATDPPQTRREGAMNVRLLLLPVIVILLASGCRKDPHMQVYIDNMNAEKRLLEDTMYDLQYDYDTKAAEVEKLRQELEELRGGGYKQAFESGRLRRERSEEPRELFPEIPDLSPPTIDQGSPSGEGPATERLEGDVEMDDLEPPKLDLGTEEDPLSVVPMPLDQQVTKLHVHPAHTGGLQQDKKPGDDGIVVVFEPRNSEDDFVPLASRVSVVLLDPETRQRVARWELSKEQTEVALQKARAGRGIELHMPWQDTPPTKSRLHLFVRYWLPDGTAVQGDREITITPNGQLAARWTPRTEQRPDPPRRRLNVADTRDRTTDATGSLVQQLAAV